MRKTRRFSITHVIDSIRAFVQKRKSPQTHAVALAQVVQLRGSSFPRWQQWKELPRFLTKKERASVRIAFGVFFVSVSVLGARQWFLNHAFRPAIGGSYIEGALGTPQYINPLYATGNDVDADLTRLVYSGLLRTDGNGAIVPDLAESYTVSDDQKTYTFLLRKNATWHDKEPVNSSDVLFTVNAIQNPEYHSPLFSSFSEVTVEATDDSTVVFTLQEPFAPFFSALTVGILPEHLWADVLPQNATLSALNIKPVGSGPFVFSKLVKDTKGTLKSYTLKRNPDFYRKTVFLNEFTMKFYGDIQELTNAVRNKNVEGASVLGTEDAESLAREGVITLQSPALSQFTGLFLNEKHSSVLADDSVRKALSLVIDRSRIVDVAVHGHATALTSPILPTMPGFDSATLTSTKDIAAAAALLEESKWTLPEGEGTVRTKNDARLSFVITTLNSPDLLAAATEIRSMWTLMGAEVTIETVDQYTLQNDVIKNHDYDILLAGERYGIFPDLYPFFHSSQISYPGLNLAGFADRKVDAAIATARTSTDIQKIQEANQLLATTLAESNLVFVLYQPQYVYGVGAKLHGTEVTTVATPADRFANVDQWYRKTSLFPW